MTSYEKARELRNREIMQEYRIKKKYQNKNHTMQELFKNYKENICKNCVNINTEDCDIRIKGNITVTCRNYKKDK